jgi:hypothetical protein
MKTPLLYMLVDDASGVENCRKAERSTFNIQHSTPKLKAIDGVVTGAILVMLAGYVMVIGYWVVIHFLK